MQIKAKIKVSKYWTSMNGRERDLYLAEQLKMLAGQLEGYEGNTKTILNTNGNTSHIEVKM